MAADRLGALASYAMASAPQTASVLVFPVLEDSLSFMVLSAVFGFGFARNMTSLSLCVRNAVPANRFGGARSSYFSGRLFGATLSYNLSFIVAGVVGTLNLLVLALISFRRRKVLQRPVGSQSLKTLRA